MKKKDARGWFMLLVVLLSANLYLGYRSYEKLVIIEEVLSKPLTVKIPSLDAWNLPPAPIAPTPYPKFRDPDPSPKC